jgi:hypothetical protein
MFWSKKDSKPMDSAVAVAELPIPEPMPVSIDSNLLVEEEINEYTKVALDLGMETDAAILNLRLEKFLKEENIHVYDEHQVIPFLDQKLGNDWVWRGLRMKDARELGGWFIESTKNNRKVYFGEEDEVYRGAVPLPVLLTAKKIQDAFPDVYFYVSDPKEGDGDPFLMVTGQKIGQYIVERWNEPNFRER